MCTNKDNNCKELITWSGHLPHYLTRFPEKTTVPGAPYRNFINKNNYTHCVLQEIWTTVLANLIVLTLNGFSFLGGPSNQKPFNIFSLTIIRPEVPRKRWCFVIRVPARASSDAPDVHWMGTDPSKSGFFTPLLMLWYFTRGWLLSLSLQLVKLRLAEQLPYMYISDNRKKKTRWKLTE